MSRLRRGHRLHSIPGFDEKDFTRYSRLDSSGPRYKLESECENEFLLDIRHNDIDAIEEFVKDPAKTLTVSQNWNFVRYCGKEVVDTGNPQLLRAVLGVMTDTNPDSYDVGEYFILETIASGNIKLVLVVLEFWMVNRGAQGNPTSLDVIHTAINYAAQKHTQDSEALSLLQTTIYCATVDRENEILKSVLEFHENNIENLGTTSKLNADCMIHAVLEEDKERVILLYNNGYRLGMDTDRRINKDYLKRIKLFKARASPVYNIVVFEASNNIYADDPLKKSFEFARQARRLANKIQDFNKEYNDIATKCENFVKCLLDQCTTKHEVQTLLQTRSFHGHTDANFNIAILDGHKAFVAHEKFQQLLHKKWGQRDRLEWKDGPSYNIFWSEKNNWTKIIHALKQFFCFFFLPFVAVARIVCNSNLERTPILSWFIRQSQIPVNRFIYWEISKFIFYIIVLMTLVDDKDVAWYDLLAVLWIISYLLENFRTIHRLYRYGGASSRTMVFKRWWTFRNIYILSTDLIFLTALILRSLAYFGNQCRRGCVYEGNEVAFIAASIWSIACLLTFLRSIQGGLMWRQTGPIIISMSYMILDVAVFLFIFVIVYISFTLCTVYVYDGYDDGRTDYFNKHKTAFKLFFWAMIRTGNPQYADVRKHNSSVQHFDSHCVSSITQLNSTISLKDLSICSTGPTNEIEEGISYIAGNSLWALYQFTVVIVLLSILRARMVNTYHRIFKEADVQWKYFRASIWWKYLDKDSALPPPFTLLFFCQSFIRYLAERCKSLKDSKMPDSPRSKCRTMAAAEDKKEFEKRYRRLMSVLIAMYRDDYDS